VDLPSLSLDGDGWTVAPVAVDGGEPGLEGATRDAVPTVVPGHPPTEPPGAAWRYHTAFDLPDEWTPPQALLRFEGLEGAAQVFLNGVEVGRHQGTFVPAEWEVAGLLRPGRKQHLAVLLAPDPTAAHPPGIWDSVTLRPVGAARFAAVSVHANLSIDRTEAALSIVCEFAAAAPTRATISTQITLDGLPVTSVEDPVTLFQSDTFLVQSCEIPRTRLWWPNGLGAQPLYQARLTLTDAAGRVLDRPSVQFGLRDIESLPCEGAGPDTPRYGLRVNGRRVWLRGWTWLPAGLPGSVPPERYEQLLTLARDAGVNALRVWGGGLLEKEDFYRLCDRHGIMVWQEFPLAPEGGAGLPTDPEGLDELRREAEAILARRRNHPSLVWWCGGTNLTDSGGELLGSDHPALAELRAAVETDDPQRLWFPTAPGGPPPVGSLGLAGLAARYDDPDRTPLLDTQIGVADPTDAELEAAFGPEASGHAAAAAELIRAVALQYAVEAARRREGACAGVFPWCFADPAGDWGLVGPEAAPTAPYRAVARAFGAFHVSAAFPTFVWAGLAEFRAEVWLHNIGPERSLLNVVAVITDLDGRELYAENLAAEVATDSSESQGDLCWRFPPAFAAPFLLTLEVIDEEGETVARNRYPHSRAAEAPFAGFLPAGPAWLELPGAPQTGHP
jgi:beta-mannosidase